MVVFSESLQACKLTITSLNGSYELVSIYNNDIITQNFTSMIDAMKHAVNFIKSMNN